jgi:serine/threonine protein kinase
VLVTLHDGVPVPKVIDFGIAKATNSELTAKTLFTEHRQMIGTPAYMSPEQAEMSGLDIDTRSDVYSLGVLLYELLTGTTPFDIRSLRERHSRRSAHHPRGRAAEAEHAALHARRFTRGIAARRHADPRSCAARARRSRLDRDEVSREGPTPPLRNRGTRSRWISRDISAEKPVTAAPPKAGYKLKKFLRRHRLGVFTTVAIAVAVALAVAGTVTFALRESSQRELAERHAEDTSMVADFQARMLRDIDAAAMGQQIRSVFREQIRASLERRFVGPYPDWHAMTAAEIETELRAFDERAVGRARGRCGATRARRAGSAPRHRRPRSGNSRRGPPCTGRSLKQSARRTFRSGYMRRRATS